MGTGMYIVEDGDEAALGLTNGEFDVPLVLANGQFTQTDAVEEAEDWLGLARPSKGMLSPQFASLLAEAGPEESPIRSPCPEYY